MAIIYTYPTKNAVAADKVLISDSADQLKTKQTPISSIKDAIDVVDSVVAGSGISVSSSTGAVTIGNTGVLSLTAGTNISLSGSTGAITIGASGVGGSGTANKIPKWSNSSTLTDSIISQPVGNAIIIAGNLSLTSGNYIQSPKILDSASSAGSAEQILSAGPSGSSIEWTSTFKGDLNGTINTATTGVTQANAVDNTTIATTAYVNNKIGLIPAVVNSISDFNGNNSLTGAVKIGSTTNVNVTFNTGTNKIDLSVLADISAGTPFSDSVIPVISGSNQLIDSPMQVSGDDLIMKRYIRHLGDNGALFGFNTDSEFLIYTESNDQESLRITPTGTAIKTNATNRFTTTAAGATELYYAGSKKFETTTTGSTLTGGLSLSDGTNNITISIPTITTSYDLKMPASIGAASQVLKLPSTIGSSPYQLTWGDAIAVPGGSTGFVQFKNSSSEFAGDASFTFTTAGGSPKLTIGDTTQDIAGIIEIQSDGDGGILKIGGGSQIYYTSIKSSENDTANYDIILPPAGPGGNNKILESTSAGILSWIPTPGVTSTNNVTASANSLNLQGSSSVAPTYGAPLNISSSGGAGGGAQTAIYIDQAATANTIGSQGVRMNFKDWSVGILVTNADSSNASVAQFRNASNQTVGTISCTSLATTYATSSDYRIKENVVDMTGAVDRVKQLKPSRFNFTADPSKIVDGFLAHEAQEVVPESVTGVKDALYPNGDPLLQGIDQSKIVPLLTGAIKELIARIEELEAK